MSATVRRRDLLRLERELNRIQGDWHAIRDAARTLVGFAQVEPDVCKACGEHVSAPHSPQCPEDALNRIAEVVQGVSPAPEWDDLDDPVLRAWRELRSGALADVETILRESGRL